MPSPRAGYAARAGGSGASEDSVRVGLLAAAGRARAPTLAETMGMGYQCWLGRETLSASRLCVGYMMEWEHCGNVDGVVEAGVIEAQERAYRVTTEVPPARRSSRIEFRNCMFNYGQERVD